MIQFLIRDWVSTSKLLFADFLYSHLILSSQLHTISHVSYFLEFITAQVLWSVLGLVENSNKTSSEVALREIKLPQLLAVLLECVAYSLRKGL